MNEIKLSDIQKMLTQSMIDANNPKSKTYIASGFFNEVEMNQVLELESTFDGLGTPFYSPRNYVTDLKTQNSALRSLRIKEILRRNIEELESCNRIVVNMQNQHKDIGTCWELGYAIGLVALGKQEIDIEILTSSDIEDAHFKNIVTNLKSAISGAVDKVETKDTLLISCKNCINFETAKSLNNWNFDNKEIASDLSNSGEFVTSKNLMFLVDNHPYQIYILMGALYAMSRSYMTASFCGFGSNVMIAASSKGHISLPGIQDCTRMQGKIE